jgi:hypothetical protein
LINLLVPSLTAWVIRKMCVAGFKSKTWALRSDSQEKHPGEGLELLPATSMLLLTTEWKGFRKI